MPEPNFYISNFLGGLNEALDKTIIKYNEACKCQNVDIDNGSLRTKKNKKLYLDLSLTQIGTVMPYFKDGVGMLLIASEGAVYKVEGGVKTQIATGFTSDKFDFINLKIDNDDCIIFGNGVEPTKVYNGTIVRDLKNDGKASADSETNKAPLGNFLELHYERVWTAKDETVYFSTATTDGFDPDDWTAPVDEENVNQHGGFIDILTNDGTKIIGLRVIFDDILIFKNKSVFKIFGTYPGNYTKVQLFSANGAISDRSIATGNNRAYFVAKDGIYVYDGTNVTPIHEKIKDTFSQMPSEALEKAVGVFYKNKYIVAIDDTIIEYNSLTQAFTVIRGIRVNHFVEYKYSLLVADDSGVLYEYGTGEPMTGMLWETGINTKNQNAIKDIQQIYFIGSGTGSVKITCITERGDKSITVPLTATDKPYSPKLRHKGRMMSFRFENIDGSDVNIKSPQAIIELDYD